MECADILFFIYNWRMFMTTHCTYIRTALWHFNKSNMSQTNSFPKWFAPKLCASDIWDPVKAKQNDTTLSCNPFLLCLGLHLTWSDFKWKVAASFASNETLSPINTRGMRFFSSEEKDPWVEEGICLSNILDEFFNHQAFRKYSISWPSH